MPNSLDSSSGDDPQGERLISLEHLLTLLERRVDQLDSVLQDHGKRFDQLERQLQQSLEELATLREHEGDQEEKRDPLEERPPHY